MDGADLNTMAGMPQFRIHRMKESARQSFRWAPHVSGSADVKIKDYEIAEVLEAENEYAAWAQLRASERPLAVGDMLENEAGELKICKYVGFEAARWIVPEAAAAPLQPAQA